MHYQCPKDDVWAKEPDEMDVAKEFLHCPNCESPMFRSLGGCFTSQLQNNQRG